jgi:Ca-activated chloride channel family protein
MSSVWFPALLILVAGAIAYGAVMVVDAIVGRRRRKLHGKRRGPQWRRRLPVALVVGAIVSLLFAFGQVRIDREVTAGTVVLAIDVSHSMGSTDVQPNRLAAAQVAASAFLDRLPAGFRVGLATFSISSSVPVLPTSDRSRVATALSALAVDTGTGTVIGDGLSSAVDAIQADRGDTGERPAAVVLLSDGQDSGSTIPPVQAAARAADLGIPVYTVAIGEATAASPAPSASTGAMPDASPDVLGEMAASTGARSFTTSTSDQLTQVYDTLGSRLSSELAIDESAGPFVIAAVIMLLAATGLLVIGNRDPYA